jgi:hypothetical protein
LSLFFFGLYFFIVNVFITKVFKGLKLKFIIHKNCQGLNSLIPNLNQLNLIIILENYLKVVNILFKKLSHRLQIVKSSIPIIGINFNLMEPTSMSFDEELYLLNYLTLQILNDLKNEI